MNLIISVLKKDDLYNKKIIAFNSFVFLVKK